MPIIGWDCPVCGQHAGLDHYLTTTCGLQIHPDYAQAILDDRATPHYITDQVTVTAGLGCPRSRALEASDEELYVNPLDYNALLAGRAWDELITKPETKLQLKGEIAGITIYGEIDRVRRVPCFTCNGVGGACIACNSTGQSDLLIEDHKHSNNNAQRFLKKEIEAGTAVKFEYRIQTSIYAELYRQQEGEQPTRGMIWNHYSGAQSKSNSVLIPLLYDLVPLDECLSYCPYGGSYTVLELYEQAASLYTETPAKWSDLPLVGETMSFGSMSYCDYCQVRSKCFQQARGAPF